MCVEGKRSSHSAWACSQGTGVVGGCRSHEQWCEPTASSPWASPDMARFGGGFWCWCCTLICVLWTVTQGSGVVQSGAEEAQERPSHSTDIWGSSEKNDNFFSFGQVIGSKEIFLDCARGGIPAGILEARGCITERHGRSGWRSDLMTLKVFFQPGCFCDSVMQWFSWSKWLEQKEIIWVFLWSYRWNVRLEMLFGGFLHLCEISNHNLGNKSTTAHGNKDSCIYKTSEIH